MDSEMAKKAQRKRWDRITDPEARRAHTAPGRAAHEANVPRRRRERYAALIRQETFAELAARKLAPGATVEGIAAAMGLSVAEIEALDAAFIAEFSARYPA